jgi:hypothetical protein
VGSVSAGSFVDSRLFAGYDGPDAGDPSAFTGDFTVGPFRVTGTAGGFVRSYVVASRLKTVTLAGVDPTISGSKFGFVYHAGLTALTVKAPAFRVDPKGPAVQDLAGTDFEVKRV